MQNKLLIYISIITFFFSCTKNDNSSEKEIENIMKEQQKCWSDGDVDCFMQYYWNDDSLRFIGSKGINYGWKTTLDNYKKSYPTKEHMGELTFDLNEVKVFTATDAYVLGKWHLERKGKENLGGHFSLLWRKIDGKWVIVSDHTS